MESKPGSSPGRTFSLDGESGVYPCFCVVKQSVIKCQNGFSHANHPLGTIVGAMTSRIDIHIGQECGDRLRDSRIDIHIGQECGDRLRDK